MKNKTVNKKVLRAMSIGLAAMMTVQPVMATPVFADDLDTQGETNTEVVDAQNEEKVTESTTTQDNLKEIQESYDDAAKAVSNIGDDLNTAVQADRVDPDFTSTDGASTKLTELNNAVTGTEIGAVDAITLDGDRKAASDAAIKLVNDAKRDDAEFELDADELMNAGVKDALKGDAIKDAAKAVDDAINEESKALDKLEEDTIKLTNEFTGIEGTIRVKTGEIERATSIPVATEALDGATEQKNIADEKFEQAKANYNQAVSDCDAAKKDVEAKKAAYEKLLSAAVADESALKKAEAELITAENDLTALENANKKAQEDLAKTTIGKLAAAVEAGSNWGNLDVIMQDVIKYYYLPGQTVDGKKVSPSDITVTRVGDSTNERNNYFKATVFGKDFYYNYICEENGKNSAYLSKMVIFEKNPEVIGNHYEDTDDKTKHHKTDDVENAKKVTIDFIKANTGSDITRKYVDIDGTYYYVDKQDVTVSQVTDQNATKNGADGVSVEGYKTKVDVTGTTVDYSNGKLTVNTKGNVTTTTFTTGNTLVDIAKTATDAVSYEGALEKANIARDEAISEALAKNGHTLQVDDEGKAIVTGNTTISADVKAKAEVEYRTKFTTTIDLTGLTAGYDSKWWDLDLAEKEEKEELANAIDDVVNNIRNYITSNYDYDEEELGGKVSNLTISRNPKLFKDNRFEIKSGVVTFTYYSKVNTAEGESTDSTQTALSGDASTEKAKADAKTNAITNVIMDNAVSSDDISDLISGHTGVGNEIHWIPTYDLNPFGGHFGEITGYLINETYEAKFGTLAASNVTTVSSLVDKNKGTLTAEDATVKRTPEIKYSYSVSNIKYADQYDTVAKDQDIFKKVCDVSELKKVDDYADIPLLNNNYYNYMADKTNKTGIVADFGDTADGIRASVMNDSNKVKDLAAKYKEAETKAANAKNNVTTAKGEVQALIKQIKDLQLEANEYDKKVQAELKVLEAKLIAAKSKLDEAEAEKAKVDATYERALAAYKDAVARLTPAPATGDEETAPTAGGGTTTAPAPTVVTTLAGTPVFALPTGGVAAPTAGVAGARTSRGAAIDSDSAAADTEDTTAKIAPTKEVEEDALAITKDTIKTIKDNETPLSSLTEDSTQKMNWWWLLLIALLGATGEEIYRRNKKKKEEEAALKAEIDKE